MLFSFVRASAQCVDGVTLLYTAGFSADDHKPPAIMGSKRTFVSICDHYLVQLSMHWVIFPGSSGTPDSETSGKRCV